MDHLSEQIVAFQDHMKRKSEENTRERKEGRKHGELSQSLGEKLRSCNPLQLKIVMKICKRYLTDHRRPPDEFECRPRWKHKIVAVAEMKNKRYQLELNDCGKKCRKCPHGPYLNSYHRDGSIIKRHYFGKAPYRGIPRKVRATILSGQDR
jgi:hypothetical protein